jgi:hypothetical protein
MQAVSARFTPDVECAVHALDTEAVTHIGRKEARKAVGLEQ